MGHAAMEAAYPKHYGASVEVGLIDGRTLKSSILDPHGMPADPCTESERLEKFARLASRVLAEQSVERVVHVVRTLERFRSSRELTAALK